MAMTDTEFDRYMDRLSLPPAAREYVISTRHSPPSRRVASNGMRNTTWRYASKKMGVSISGESTLERNYHVLLDFNPEVLEFWEQPISIPLLIEDAKNRLRRVPYTPDVLVLERNGVYVDQVKPISSCLKLIQTQPNRWTNSDNTYRDVAAQSFLQSIGLTHRVITDEEINPTKVNNLLAVARANAMARRKSYRKLAVRMIDLLREQGALVATEAMAKTGINDSTFLLQMIADELILANLNDFDIGTLERIWLATDQTQLLSIQSIAKLQNGAAECVSHVACGRDATILLARLEAMQGSGVCSKRTLRRWRRVLREAGGDVLSLAPRFRSRGNRLRRIDASEIALIAKIIRNHYMSPSAPTAAASYRRYLNTREDARKHGRISSQGRPVSEPTFRMQIELVDLEAREAARGGPRAANASALPVSPEKKEPTAARPFQRGHIDHYFADLHTVIHVERDSVHTRRVWVTVLRDEYSGMVLALSVRLKAPSRTACAMVLRDCVRRNSRLPETIVVDNGKEFESTYFEVLLAKYGISKQSRPPGAPRFGSSIESLFKSMREFLRTLPGSTKNDDRGRSVSAKFRGQVKAMLGIEATYEAIERFCFEAFNQNPVRGGEHSPLQLHESGLRQSPYSGIAVEMNHRFLALSAIPTGRFVRIDPRRGIRHLDRWFFSLELCGQKPGCRAEVLVEPWSENQIYAVIRGKIAPCYHGQASHVLDYSHKSMLQALLARETSEIRTAKAKVRGQKLDKIVQTVIKKQGMSKNERNRRDLRKPLPQVKKVVKPFCTVQKGGAV